MKTVKTIVATAVVVLALATVAMAGVQRLDGGAGGGQATTATPATQTQQAAAVTLSAAQFAALLEAVHDDGAGERANHAAQVHETAQHQERARAARGDHVGGTSQRSADGRQDDAPSGAGQGRHETVNQHNGTHSGGTHDASPSVTHSGGTHDATHAGSTHSGGCD